MIDPTQSSAMATFTGNSGKLNASTSGGKAKGGFDAALDAELRAQASAKAQADEMAAIRSKGFVAWARDTQIEKLKTEIRRKVMAEMGVDDTSMNKLAESIRRVIEQKIKEEVERRLAATLEGKPDEPAKSAADSREDGKNGDGAARADQAKTTQAEGSLFTNPPHPGKNVSALGKKDPVTGTSCPVIAVLAWPGGESLF